MDDDTLGLLSAIILVVAAVAMLASVATVTFFGGGGAQAEASPVSSSGGAAADGSIPESSPTPTTTTTTTATTTAPATTCDGRLEAGYNESASPTYIERCEPTPTETETPTPTPTPTPTETPESDDDDDDSSSGDGSDGSDDPTTTEPPTTTETPTETCDDLAAGDDTSALSHDQYGMWIADRYVEDLLTRDGVRAVGEGVYGYTEDRAIYVNTAPDATVDLPCQVQGITVDTNAEYMWFSPGYVDGGQLWVTKTGDGTTEYPPWFIEWVTDRQNVNAYVEHQECDPGCETEVSLRVRSGVEGTAAAAPAVLNGREIDHRPAE